MGMHVNAKMTINQIAAVIRTITGSSKMGERGLTYMDGWDDERVARFVAKKFPERSPIPREKISALRRDNFEWEPEQRKATSGSGTAGIWNYIKKIEDAHEQKIAECHRKIDRLDMRLRDLEKELGVTVTKPETVA